MKKSKEPSVSHKSSSVKLSPEKAPFPMTAERVKKLYRDMVLIRRFEEKAGQLYGMGQIAGFCHLYIGQEAVVVGAKAAMEPQDTMITSYRDHGHMLACDMDPKGVMAELTGRIGGYSKGKGGSMHMFSREKNFFGGHGIVAAQVPLGTGMAFAHRYLKDNAVCLCFLGDGAANQGQVYESFNMAALWSLPVVYVIENNLYGMGTSVARSSAGNGFQHRGEPYGIEGRQVDGMDLFAVLEAMSWALGQARSGKPVLLEVMTYRYRGHSMSDPAKYRTKEEVETMREKHDPIETCREALLKTYGVSEASLKTMEQEIKAIVAEAATFALESPEPEAAELYTDILLEPAI
ncbi:MAG: pyruvate dehydrogenase (acetyl-transferring) E1 component subunit alpha [Alphaproteobacteria bacterium]